MEIFNPPGKKKDDMYVTVQYSEVVGFYTTIDGKEYPIIYIDELDHYEALYSLPNNDRHPDWTKKKFDNVYKPHIVVKYWARHKPGLTIPVRIKGDVVVHNPDFT